MPDDQRVVRRRRGPFKRSRTGCGTCKRRGKKCDEMWSPEGFCQRCLAGPWDCTGSSATSSVSLSRSASSSTAPSSSSMRGMSGGSLGSLENGMNGFGVSRSSIDSSIPHPMMPPLQNTNRVISPTSVAPCLSPTSILQPSRSSSVTSAGMSTSPLAPTGPLVGRPPEHQMSNGVNNINVVPHNHAPNPHFTPTPNADGITHFTTMWNGFLTPADANRPLQQGFTQPLFDWPASSQTAPSALLTANPDGSIAIDPASQPLNTDHTVSELWTDLSASFTPNSSSQPPIHPSSRVLILNSDRPMRQGVSLAEIYARVVESWLVGLPRPTRDYARARILAVNDSNSVMRAVRYAVAVAYIFLFASDPREETPLPKPKLAELACRGAGIDTNGVSEDGESRRNSGQNSGTSSAEGMRTPAFGESLSKVSSEKEGSAIRALRLYVDHVSAPFAADLESTKWTEDAVRELQHTIVTSRQQLSDLLWGVIDLQLVEFIRGGAAPSYNMLALGDRLVQQALGGEHPPLKLSDLRTSETFSLRLYALSDVSRCIVQRGRRTIFIFSVDSDDAPVNGRSANDDEPWSSYLGLPDAIVVMLANIVNLCADQTLSSDSPACIKQRADAIEHALRTWIQSPVANVSGVDSRAVVSRTIAGELWRNSALVLLYQSVHRVGSLHPVLRRAQAEILSLLDSVTHLPNGDLWGFIALPAFLAACLSTADEDRKRAMSFLLRTGPERVWLDNIALVESVWEETDRTGHLVEWHDKMIREGLSVAFF